MIIPCYSYPLKDMLLNICQLMRFVESWDKCQDAGISEFVLVVPHRRMRHSSAYQTCSKYYPQCIIVYQLVPKRRCWNNSKRCVFRAGFHPCPSESKWLASPASHKGYAYRRMPLVWYMKLSSMISILYHKASPTFWSSPPTREIFRLLFPMRSTHNPSMARPSPLPEPVEA
jgi:hypothetical protein